MPPEVPAEAEAVLTGDPLTAHLATCHENTPHVAPIWFTYRDGTIELATTGRKLANIRANPRVALSVQKTEGGEPQWGMTIRGTATVVDDAAESQAILRRINRRYGTTDDAWSENTSVRVTVSSVNHWQY